MILSYTKSVCPVCLKKLEARRVLKGDGKIYLEKTCPLHGDFSALIWDGDLSSYQNWGQNDKKNIGAGENPNCLYDCGLCDYHEVKGCCVLIEITNRCNLNCPVCFAQAGETPQDDMSLEEIEKIYDMLLERGGPFNIQLSGGEPTVRDDIDKIILSGKQRGFSFFQLNTNGIRIAREEGCASYLKRSGVSCVFLQFDGVSDDEYMQLRGQKLLDLKLKAVENCIRAGLPLVLVPTVVSNVNTEKIGDIIRFALSNMPYIRGVHFQPVSFFGRNELDKATKRVTIPNMLEFIDTQTGDMFKTEDFSAGSVESPYCSFHASYYLEGPKLTLLKKSSSSCCGTSEYARNFVMRKWGEDQSDFRLNAPRENCCECSDGQSMDEFLVKIRQNTFTLSGMLFQDAYNFDFERLRRCYISEADMLKGMVPFCAYNLTDSSGKGLYRK